MSIRVGIEQAISECTRQHRIEVSVRNGQCTARLVAAPREVVMSATAASATAAVFNLSVAFSEWSKSGGRLL